MNVLNNRALEFSSERKEENKMEDGKGNWINRKRFGCFVLRFSPLSPPVKRTLDPKKSMGTEI